ncbi:MAG: hypothetical protein JSW66_02450 [Phycisphaerales bacterium]|nr:MAG: hypothetical protein JSW66_02450 [Phycisphaerales bacterium]
MKIIFVTQGEYALFYLDVLPLLAQKLTLDRVGFYVTGRSNHARYLKRAARLNLNVDFLNGWDLTSAEDGADDDFVKTLEDEFGEPFLWNALVIDRRIYNGILTKYKQDYRPRFTHDEMLAVLQKSFKAVLQFVEEIEPDIIIGGFTPVTSAEYIFYRCAKVKGIKYMNLNPTKILNRVTFSQDIYREFPHFHKDYAAYLQQQDGDVFLEQARQYLQAKDKKYEGVITSSAHFPCGQWLGNTFKYPFVVARYYLRKTHLDNEERGCQWGYFYRNIRNPIRDKIVRVILPYCSLEMLSQWSYAYYPLHVEPEIALSLFGREYLNQIELIRNIAKSVPVTWKLVVKDHPAGVGRRNIGYYRRLLEIPNVVLVDHYVDSERIVENARMVFTVSGFSGFEAILKRKPVITFGTTFYDVLPDEMVRCVRSLRELPGVVKDLLNGYRYSERDVVSLIAAALKNSTPLNLYEDVLNKKGRTTVDSTTFDEQKREFADFLLRSMG